MAISILGIGQVNELKKDSLSSNDYHYRVDVGFSLFQFMIMGINPKYSQHLYVSLSKNKPNWRFTPSIGFLYARKIDIKDSTYFGKRFGNLNSYLTFKLVRNNFPKRQKRNLYYGLLLGGYYSYRGYGYSVLFKESKVLGLSICPLVGFDQKIGKNFRFFCEIQMGLICQRISEKEFLNNELYRDIGSSTEFAIFSYTPFLFGFSLIIN